MAFWDVEIGIRMTASPCFMCLRLATRFAWWCSPFGPLGSSSLQYMHEFYVDIRWFSVRWCGFSDTRGARGNEAYDVLFLWSYVIAIVAAVLLSPPLLRLSCSHPPCPCLYQPPPSPCNSWMCLEKPSLLLSWGCRTNAAFDPGQSRACTSCRRKPTASCSSCTDTSPDCGDSHCHSS